MYSEVYCKSWTINAIHFSREALAKSRTRSVSLPGELVSPEPFLHLSFPLLSLCISDTFYFSFCISSHFHLPCPQVFLLLLHSFSRILLPVHSPFSVSLGFPKVLLLQTFVLLCFQAEGILEQTFFIRYCIPTKFPPPFLLLFLSLSLQGLRIMICDLLSSHSLGLSHSYLQSTTSNSPPVIMFYDPSNKPLTQHRFPGGSGKASHIVCRQAGSPAKAIAAH